MQKRGDEVMKKLDLNANHRQEMHDSKTHTSHTAVIMCIVNRKISYISPPTIIAIAA